MAKNWSWVTKWFARSRQECPECHSGVSKAEAFCEVCGYDLVRDAKSGSGPRAAY